MSVAFYGLILSNEICIYDETYAAEERSNVAHITCSDESDNEATDKGIYSQH